MAPYPCARRARRSRPTTRSHPSPALSGSLRRAHHAAATAAGSLRAVVGSLSCPPVALSSQAASAALSGGPVAHVPALASRPLFRRCRRILSITVGSWISAITRICPPHAGHTSGSTS